MFCVSYERERAVIVLAENFDVTALLLEVIYHPKIVSRGGDG